MKKQKVLIIAGPTAVGKTLLGIKCANLFNGEIISADCMQIYKGLDIGTAKASADEQKLAKHHMIDVVSPLQEFSVADYKNSASKIIDNLISKNKLPIIVGGTGLYIQSLLFPFEYGNSQKNLEIREKYKKLLEQKGKEYLYNLLKNVDSLSAQKLHENDTKRVIRALEIYELTGKPKSTQIQEKTSNFDYKFIFLNTDRQVLYNRINMRVDSMIKNGLEAEIKSLLNQGITKENQCMQGIGYKEFFDYYENKISYEQLIEKIKQNSRNYAKRQITWFKHTQSAEEYDIKNMDKILLSIEQWLNS